MDHKYGVLLPSGLGYKQTCSCGKSGAGETREEATQALTADHTAALRLNVAARKVLSK